VTAGELATIRELFEADRVSSLASLGNVPDIVAALNRLREDPEFAARMGLKCATSCRAIAVVGRRR